MELEKSILSSLTTTAGIQKAWNKGLRTEHFELGGSVNNRGIYEFIIDYWFKSKKAPTSEVLTTEFPHFFTVEPEESLDWMIDKIQSRYRKNQINILNEKVAMLNDSKDADDNKKALLTLNTESFAIAQSLMDRQSIANMASGESLDARQSRYAERALFDKSVMGAPTGFQDVDEHIFGILPGELAVVAGYSGTGKTWALLWAAYQAYLKGFRPYVVTLEVPKDDMEDRMDCVISGVPYTDLLRGTLDRDQLKKLKDAQELLRDTGFMVIDNPGQGYRNVATIVNKAMQAESNFLIIDQLSFIEDRGKTNNTRDKYGEIMNDLKVGISSNEDKIAAYMAVQFNRSQKADKGRGGQWNIGESSYVERTADHVFGITQTEELVVNQCMYWDIMKCRRQAPASWLLNWKLKKETSFSVNMGIPREGE